MTEEENEGAEQTAAQIEEAYVERSRAYKHVFNADSAIGEKVLEDLARFCRFYETPYNADPVLMNIIIGRQETFLYILKQLNLTFEELKQIAAANPRSYNR